MPRYNYNLFCTPILYYDKWFCTLILVTGSIHLGIGIDDMFVIMQSLSNVKRSPATASLTPDLQIAEALRHAGVAVTVTR